VRYNNKRNRDDCKTWVRHYSSVRNVEEVDEQDGSTHIVGGERGDMVSANRQIRVCEGEKRFICDSVGSAILPDGERGLK